MTDLQKEYQAFFDSRMKPLGVTDENNTIDICNPEAEPPMPSINKEKIFSQDQQGNIIINYWTIEGDAIMYQTDAKNPKMIAYQTKRLMKPRGDMKYNMPKGVGVFPWWHPITVKAYKEGEKIETLYLTEGVFKSWKAGQNGVHVCGLSSITHYADSETKKLHTDIVKVIEMCLVENVVVLWDGDCYNISEKGVKVREEATKRPSGFFNAAKKIRNLVQAVKYKKTREAPRIFFMNINSHTFSDNPKGLDDVIISAEKKGGNSTKLLIEDMKRVDKKGPYFYRTEITNTTDILHKQFALHDAETFYHRHALILGEDDFLFKGSRYQYSEAQNELRLLQPEWAKHIYWVGDEFYEDLTFPSAYGDKRKLEHRKKDTLSARFGRGFTQYIKYYHGFVNVPSHFEHKQIIEVNEKEYYNRYFPFQHIPKEGQFPTIMKLLKHVFGTHEVEHAKTQEKIPNYELGMDYLQLLLTEPQRKLPIIVLYSQENQTGKSTFGNLQKAIFGDNVIFVGNADLQSDFNEPYADKLLVICEETSLQRHQDANRFKNLSTTMQTTINPKGQKQYEIDFIAKFQFYSNKRRMVYVTKHDDRYWILKVNAINVDDRDPNMDVKMKKEIPAFVQHLKTRKLKTKNEGRMHFHQSLIITDIFNSTVRVNEPTQATDVRQKIRDMFLSYDHIVDKIEMPLYCIKDEFFNKNSNGAWIEEILKDYLQVDLERDKQGKTILRRGRYEKVVFNEYADDGEGELQAKVVKWKGRAYVFNRKDFVSDDDIVEMEEYTHNDDNVTPQQGEMPF